MTLQDRIKDFRNKLYMATGSDWTLYVSISLSEPTCPCASIVPDDDREMRDLTRYSAVADTIDNAINAAMDAAYAELIEDKIGVAEGLPWTNPADHKFFDWLAQSRQRLTDALASHQKGDD